MKMLEYTLGHGMPGMVVGITGLWQSILSISVVGLLSILGLLCMVAEMVNLRRFVLPISVIGLLVILGIDIAGWSNPQQLFYSNMLFINNFSVAFSALLILLTALILILSGNFYKNEASKISDYVAIIIFTLCGAVA